jgi:molybdenum cofactor cytidylyltransferase
MIAGLLLAAGASTRMGAPKQLLDWGGVPLVRHVAVNALQARLDALYIVLGAHAQPVAQALDGLSVTLVENPGYAEGLGSSLRSGVAALPAQTTAVVVLLGDQPLVTPALIDRLIEAAHDDAVLISAPLVDGRRANPVLFKATLFPALLQTRGDQGARAVIAAHQQALRLVPADEGAAVDIDTPEAYARLRPQHPTG